MGTYIERSDGQGLTSNWVEKSNFGKEKIAKVDCENNVNLNGTTVVGNVDAGNSVKARDADIGGIIDAGNDVELISTTCRGLVDAWDNVKASDSDVGGVDAGNSAELISTTCHGKVFAGSSITLMDSKVSKKTDADTSITAYRSNLLGPVISAAAIELRECPHVHSISTGGAVILQETAVQGNVRAGGDVSIKSSKIGGTLTCVSKHLIIDGSSIDTIDLRCKGVFLCKLGHTNHLFEHPFCQEQSLLKKIRNAAFHILTLFIPLSFYYATGQNSSSGTVRIQAGHSVFIGSGVTINGVIISNLQAQQDQEEMSQVLELRNCKVRNVIFEGKKGEVVLTGDSQVTGTITGGKVRTES